MNAGHRTLSAGLSAEAQGAKADGIGVTVNVPRAADLGALSVNATLFGESASRIVVSVAADRLEDVLSEAAAVDVSLTEIGQTGGDRIRISVDGQVAIDTTVGAAEHAWATAIEKKMVSGNQRGR